MDKFDEKLKQMAQSESWEIPDNIDSNISRLLNDIDKPKKAKKKPLKVAVLVASISLFTITTAFAMQGIVCFCNVLFGDNIAPVDTNITLLNSFFFSLSYIYPENTDAEQPHPLPPQ